ncbi:MAG: tetraacyldisaccharide 4'-kinase [Sideroxydans sp.]
MSPLPELWYRPLPSRALLLYPLALLFHGLVTLRRLLYRHGILGSQRLPVPVIVVGNLTVGGTGKTPLTLWLVQQLIEAGWHPGIISRGYRRSGPGHASPRAVTVGEMPQEVGDEALLMAQRRLCPVWIGRDRAAVGKALLQAHPECDVLVSDDGLQHYRLQRDVEIVVIDGIRRFGNRLLLPAGPLREPLGRLDSVDVRVCNGGTPQAGEYSMQLQGARFYNLLNPSVNRLAQDFAGQRLHAVAGIGHPQRFFRHLQSLGLPVQAHAFPDHHEFTAHDLAFADADAVLMTEKDAVKCRTFATERHWVLRVDAELDPALAPLIINKVTSSWTQNCSTSWSARCVNRP